MVGYVTVDEANEYVRSHYTANENETIAWNALNDADHEIVLRRAFEQIEVLPYRGIPNGEKEFPRKGMIDVPEAVKYAQIEQALRGLTEPLNQSVDMFARGVSSFSIDDYSEELLDISKNPNSVYTQAGITSYRVIGLLRPYVSGGFRIE